MLGATGLHGHRRSRSPEGIKPSLARARIRSRADPDYIRSLMVDLERCVVDVEALFEHTLELCPDRVTVVTAMDEDVCGERREARTDLPDVQIVHRRDMGMPGD